jgi:hypothetical protein
LCPVSPSPASVRMVHMTRETDLTQSPSEGRKRWFPRARMPIFGREAALARSTETRRCRHANALDGASGRS